MLDKLNIINGIIYIDKKIHIISKGGSNFARLKKYNGFYYRW